MSTKARLIKLLLSSLLFSLIPFGAQADQTTFVNTSQGQVSVATPSSRTTLAPQRQRFAYTQDANGNRIADTLESQVSALGNSSVPVLIQSSSFMSTAGQLSNLGLEVDIVSSTIGQISTSLPAQTISSISRFPYIKLIELDSKIQLIAPPVNPNDYGWYDGGNDQNPKQVDTRLSNLKASLGATGGTNPNTYSVTDDQVIAIIDTGIDSEHVLLNGGKVIHRENFMPYDAACIPTEPTLASNGWDIVGHGTQVASIASGRMQTDWHPFSDGVAPGAAIIDLKVFGCANSTYSSTVNSSLEWVIQNHVRWSIDVVNMSLGGESETTDGTSAQERLVNIITSLGIVVVVAAGNSGPSLSTIAIPASAKHVISVGAMRMGISGESISSYSSKGPTSDGRNGVDILAPGTDYYVARARTTGFTGYQSLAAASGTSFAAPFVSGLVALMLAANSSLKPSGDNCSLNSSAPDCSTYGVVDASIQNPIEEMLKQDCGDWGATGADPQSGCGYIRAARALQRAYGSAPTVLYPTLCRFTLTSSTQLTRGFYVTPGTEPAGINVVSTTGTGGFFGGARESFFSDKDWTVQGVRTDGTTLPLRRNSFSGATDTMGRSNSNWIAPYDESFFIEIVSRTSRTFNVTTSGTGNCPSATNRWSVSSNPSLSEGNETATALVLNESLGNATTVLPAAGVTVETVTATTGSISIKLKAPVNVPQQGTWKSNVMVSDGQNMSRVQISIIDSYTALPTVPTLLSVAPTGEPEGAGYNFLGKAAVSSDGSVVVYTTRSATALGLSADSEYSYPVIHNTTTGTRIAPFTTAGALNVTGQVDFISMSNDGTTFLFGLWPGGSGAVPGDTDLWYELFLYKNGVNTRIGLTTEERPSSWTSWSFEPTLFAGELGNMSQDGKLVVVPYPISATRMALAIRPVDTPTALVVVESDWQDVWGSPRRPKITNNTLVWGTSNSAIIPAGATSAIMSYNYFTNDTQVVTIGVNGSPILDYLVPQLVPITDPTGRYVYFLYNGQILKRDLQLLVTTVVPIDRDFDILAIT
jgi:serine protease AprX